MGWYLGEYVGLAAAHVLEQYVPQVLELGVLLQGHLVHGGVREGDGFSPYRWRDGLYRVRLGVGDTEYGGTVSSMAIGGRPVIPATAPVSLTPL